MQVVKFSKKITTSVTRFDIDDIPPTDCDNSYDHVIMIKDLTKSLY